MRHEYVRASLSALLDGVLEPCEAEAVEAHLRDCSSCAADLAKMRAMVSMLREVEPVMVPEGFAAAVRGRIEQATTRGGRGIRARLPVWLSEMQWSWRTAAAAAAVALIGVFGLNLARQMWPGAREEQEVSQAEAPPAGSGLRAQEPAAPQFRDQTADEGADSRNARAKGALRALPAPPTLPGAAPPPGTFALRQVIRSGSLAMEVEKFDDAARRLLAIAEASGGFVASSSYSEQGGVPRGAFEVRVPAARFGDVTQQIEQLGTVQRREYRGQDVTEEFIDLEARVRNLQRQETRLLSFMERATKVQDLMAVESEVARVRGEIERLVGRQRFMSNRIELATIQAEISEKRKKAPGGFWDFERTLARLQMAFLSTVQQILVAVEGIAAFTAALLPLVLLGLLGWFVVRRSTHRSEREA